MDEEPARKRQRISITSDSDITIAKAPVASPGVKLDTDVPVSSTQRISPPATRRARTIAASVETQSNIGSTFHVSKTDTAFPIRSITSPIQLSLVDGLSSAYNVETVTLRDIVGDPLIKECWVFNYLFDVDFLISNFDEDVRDTVGITIVHGSWKKEDSNRLMIENAVRQHQNLKAITAYMPEAFGTHHSKMIILIRHDEQAQINILTANMVAGDWRMCQAVWRSPLVPLLGETINDIKSQPVLPSIGSGLRFKHDILAYLGAYGSKLKELIVELKKYDFSSVRGALVASTPKKQNLWSTNPETETVWGWPGLKNALSKVPANSHEQAHIVMQVSSVASLGAGDKWLVGTFQKALFASSQVGNKSTSKPKFSLVFPTPDEIRRSLDGYDSGGSIHMKIQSAAQSKQLDYLRPLLCHWAGDGVGLGTATTSASAAIIREAGRRRAAPHIKTYIRFTDTSMTQVDWALVTSANLSTQAWGAAANATGDVRICSYEIGVLVWPALWKEHDLETKMVPVFKKDQPEVSSIEDPTGPLANRETIIGLRMPYDLPLVPYDASEKPWCATAPDNEPDWMGRAWPGFGM